MLRITLKDVAELAGGRLDGDPDAVVAAVSTDTRRLPEGALFVALRGDRADGHDFLPRARTAAAALVRDDASVPAGLATIRVPDPLAALQRLAAGVRGRLPVTVVAITGSSGKTCTKDFTAAVLGRSRRVTASEASYNNEIGVPLTVLAADERTEVIVAEVGARARGQIASLMPVLSPDVAIVTNVGPAHFGIFGSVEAIAEAKAELVDALGPDGCAVLNADDERVSGMGARCAGAVIGFGVSDDAEVRAADLRLDDRAQARFRLVTPAGEAGVRLSFPGEHMVPNALAAAAAGHRLGIPPPEIAAALAGVEAPQGRMQVLEAAGGWRVIHDAYNANPTSTAAALRTLVAMGRGRGTWAVLGLMAELGERSGEEHDRIGRLAARLGVGRLVVVGEGGRGLLEAARDEGMAAEQATSAPDVSSAIASVRAGVAPGDVVLVKASRVAGLERVVEGILR